MEAKGEGKVSEEVQSSTTLGLSILTTGLFVHHCSLCLYYVLTNCSFVYMIVICISTGNFLLFCF